MPNTKTAKARDITNERNRQRNAAIKSKMKTYVKEAATALDTKNAEALKQSLTKALSEIDRAATKGVLHPNSAARKKSTLQRRAAALAKA
ncbi:MAG TPA: 30S ribosomal protein S20 [Candidatus Hydrogenedentes bacterium]|nr:30S ribosomal protein S20 [Candidatus Hydrogenedentota bacterium]